MKMLLATFLVLTQSCTIKLKNERVLTQEEIEKFNLQDTLHEAEICHNKFDSKLQILIVDGPCEKIRCEVVDEKTKCMASPKK